MSLQDRAHLGHTGEPLFVGHLILVRVCRKACVSPCVVVEVQQLGVRVLQELVERRVGLSQRIQFLAVALDLPPETLFERPTWLTTLLLLACSCSGTIMSAQVGSRNPTLRKHRTLQQGMCLLVFSPLCRAGLPLVDGPSPVDAFAAVLKLAACVSCSAASRSWSSASSPEFDTSSGLSAAARKPPSRNWSTSMCLADTGTACSAASRSSSAHVRVVL